MGLMRAEAPNLLLIELFPFGRKAFRFELDPLLAEIDAGRLPACKVVCSVRDILVEKENAAKHESRAVDILNRQFDALLVHADPRVVRLEEGRVADEEPRRALEAYSRGVNAGRSSGCRRPAHAFTLLRAQPTPHTAADVLTYVKVMSFSMSANWCDELARLNILRQDGPQALAAVDPGYPAWHPVTAPVGLPLYVAHCQASWKHSP